jgi:hypothetical protein
VVASDATLDLNSIIPELHLKDGRVLQNVKIVSYGTSTVMAKWDGGRGTIPYKQLPDDFQEAMKAYMPPPPIVEAPIVVEAPIPGRIASEPPPSPGPAKTVTGQVFIATKGGENFKLALVGISVYPVEVWTIYEKQVEGIAAAKQKKLETKQKAFEANGNYHGSIQTLNEELALSFDKWDLLPPPTASTKTDADGKFSLVHTVPSPVIFARARRSVGKETEYYVWVVKEVTPPVLLSNDNLTETVSF